MNKKTILFSFLSIFSLLSFSQEEPKKKFAKAENYFLDSNYAQAIPLYLELIETDKENANLNFRLGMCYLSSPFEYKKSITYLEKASADVSVKYKEGVFKERHAPVVSILYLADAYHLNYRFDEAIVKYELFLAYIDESDKATIKMVKRKITMCKTAKELITTPVELEIKNLGTNVNSPFADYSPVISADQSVLIFTSRRSGTGGKIDENGNFFEDIYICYKTDSGWGEAKNIGTPINTDGHEATIGTSVDGQQLFIYKDDKGDGNIYTTSLKGDMWGVPLKMNANINSKFWEPSASLSADGNTFYFVSDSLDGFGGRDIYRCKKLPNGQWSKAQNLGSGINTAYEEDAPFIHPDGKTLYFSSQGHQSMGGFDIFTSVTITDSGWTAPKNIGYPINTTGDDIFYVPTPDGKHAFYSSFREDGIGEKDIYMITLPKQEEIPLIVYSGEIVSIYGGVPANTVVVVTDNESGEVVGRYYPNTKSGKYVFILPPGKNYNITYEADDYLFVSENLDVSDTSAYTVIKKPVELMPIKVGSKLILKNIFFKSGKAELQPESKTELDRLAKLMLQYPNLIVEISGHTDAQGGDELNQKLSVKRAQAVADYLIAGGIAAKRIKVVGYGEAQPIAKNKNPDGSWNKKGMALNRRFEFKILSVDGFLDVVEPINVPDNLKDKKK